MRRTLVVPLALVATMLAVSPPASTAADSLTVQSGSLEVVVEPDPFRVSFRQPGVGALEDASPSPLDLTARYGTLAFAVDVRVQLQPPEIGYGVFLNVPVRWFHATRIVSHHTEGGALVLDVETDDPLGRMFRVIFAPTGEGVVSVDATLDNTAGVTATGWSFASQPGERFVGFGERSDAADQTGREVESWNEEGPFSAGAFKPQLDPIVGDRWQGPPPIPGTNYSMPWLLSSRGYGFLADSSYPNRFRLNTDRSDAWNVEIQEPAFRARVFAGPTPADVVRRLGEATGRQPDPAPWFFGPWYQPAGPNDFRVQLTSLWREWDVPVTVAQTYTHYLPCGSHLANRQAERDRVKLYHDNGYMVTTYVNSFMCNAHPRFQEGNRNGYFVKTALGTTYPVPYLAANLPPDPPYSAVVDFTNPDATAWWQGLITEALDDGYDGWMEDFGEYVPPDAVMHDGRSGLAAHNEYCTMYHRASQELTAPLRGLDFAQFVRCGYTGTAPYARIVWGGDPTTDWSKADGLAAAVSQGLSMGLSGIGFWGTDIGGFHALFTEGQTDAELLIRWLEFGTFNGIMRTQADGYPRPGDDSVRSEVWDDDVRPVWRKYAKLRTQLFPYISAAADEYVATGMPIMRHLALAYPSDPMVWTPEAEYEFLFGPDLLVAPVVEEGATTRTLYLPPGEWLDFWSATTYDEQTGRFDAVPGGPILSGGRVITVEAPLDRIPLFVRAGTCLRLLPPEVDTLAEHGELPGLVHLGDVAGQERTLGFGAGC
ncbi:MAG TPA: TIM-barrel domain-containing protein [Actinomycetota bacterium]|nr:TIM-barrel domain-containing protein [Actinomycetota bacterium]